ncbi:hypothetical protein ACHAXT_011263 [Thalassiosira profunda]
MPEPVSVSIALDVDGASAPTLEVGHIKHGGAGDVGGGPRAPEQRQGTRDAVAISRPEGEAQSHGLKSKNTTATAPAPAAPQFVRDVPTRLNNLPPSKKPRKAHAQQLPAKKKAGGGKFVFNHVLLGAKPSSSKRKAPEKGRGKTQGRGKSPFKLPLRKYSEDGPTKKRGRKARKPDEPEINGREASTRGTTKASRSASKSGRKRKSRGDAEGTGKDRAAGESSKAVSIAAEPNRGQSKRLSLEKVVGDVVDAVADEIRYCASMFGARRPKVVIGDAESPSKGASDAASGLLESCEVDPSTPPVGFQKRGRVHGQKATASGDVSKKGTTSRAKDTSEVAQFPTPDGTTSDDVRDFPDLMRNIQKAKRLESKHNASAPVAAFVLKISKKGTISRAGAKHASSDAITSKGTSAMGAGHPSPTSAASERTPKPQIGDPEDSSAAFDARSVIAAVRRFALEVYCPYLVAAKRSTGKNPSNHGRIRISVLLAIREMLIMNGDRLFAFPFLKQASGGSVKERRYLSLVFANAIVRNAVKRLPRSEGVLHDDIIQAARSYDTQSDEFQFSLAPEDARSVYLHPEGAKVGPEEALLAKVGFNYARTKHPLLGSTQSQEHGDGSENAGRAKNFSPPTPPLPTACAVFHVELADAHSHEPCDDDAKILESLEQVLKRKRAARRGKDQSEEAEDTDGITSTKGEEEHLEGAGDFRIIAKRCCDKVGCPNKGGRCLDHGKRARTCRVSGCNRFPKLGGLCLGHCELTECKEKGCNKPTRESYCRKHRRSRSEA